jgi:hypothetical protein
VVEALRNNAVPEELLAAVRRVPLPARGLSPAADFPPGLALGDAEAALRLAHHEPLLERGLRAVAAPGAGAAGRAGLAGALLGARDGAEAIPDGWTSRDDGNILGALAVRLVRVDSPATRSPPPSRT